MPCGEKSWIEWSSAARRARLEIVEFKWQIEKQLLLEPHGGDSE
jgi:hypothetical protein